MKKFIEILMKYWTEILVFLIVIVLLIIMKSIFVDIWNKIILKFGKIIQTIIKGSESLIEIVSCKQCSIKYPIVYDRWEL